MLRAVLRSLPLVLGLAFAAGTVSAAPADDGPVTSPSPAKGVHKKKVAKKKAKARKAKHKKSHAKKAKAEKPEPPRPMP